MKKHMLIWKIMNKHPEFKNNLKKIVISDNSVYFHLKNTNGRILQVYSKGKEVIEKWL